MSRSAGLAFATADGYRWAAIAAAGMGMAGLGAAAATLTPRSSNAKPTPALPTSLTTSAVAANRS